MPVNTVTLTSKNPTSKQLAVLKLLYQFRFGTTDLIARALELKDGRYIHTRLEALIAQEYIGKNYDSTYKLDGKRPHIIYCRKHLKRSNNNTRLPAKSCQTKPYATPTKTKKPHTSSSLASWPSSRSTTSYEPYMAQTSSSGRRTN
jgi:hypothetical protein